MALYSPCKYNKTIPAFQRYPRTGSGPGVSHALVQRVKVPLHLGSRRLGELVDRLHMQIVDLQGVLVILQVQAIPGTELEGDGKGGS